MSTTITAGNKGLTSLGWRTELLVFGVAYVIYNVARWIFYNPLAAVPSLHVGFAFAVGFALAAALQPRWAKALVLLWGPVVSLSVVATGNHYVFDIAAGLLVTVLGFAVGRNVSRRTLRRPWVRLSARVFAG